MSLALLPLLLVLAVPGGAVDPSPLVRELSPYLRSHAGDAAGFLPWGGAAFERARSEARPVFLLIGRAACHACAVRERALLGDAEIADLLGRGFVPVLVDADERPDLAAVYSSALALVAEAPAAGSGWPLLALLTADGRPFFTALSRSDPAFASGMKDLLRRLAENYARERGTLEASAGATVARLREAQAGQPPRAPLGEDALARALRGLEESFDRAHGGFGLGPKAPHHAALRFLLAERRRTGSARALYLATRTLDAMARSAVRDRGAGGFFSGSADDAWRLPRSEKTLADNALLLRAYALAQAESASPAYRDVVSGIVSWTVGMQDPQGGFRTSLDGSIDERVIAGPNGLMIGALAVSGSRLDRPADVDAARSAAVRVLERLGPPEALAHEARGTERGGPALLDDYAYFAEGLLDLHEATGEARWRKDAVALAEAALGRFLDPARGGFFIAGDGADAPADPAGGPVLVRLEDAYDGALPSPNGVMAAVLLRLARVTGEKRYAELGRNVVLAFLGDLQRAPSGLETLAAAAGELLGPPETPRAEEEAEPARVVRGPVVVEASLSSGRARTGTLLEARVALFVSKPWCIPAHDPLAKGLVGLSVGVPDQGLTPLRPRYPEGTAVRGGFAREIAAVHFDEADVVVPLRVPPDAPPGERKVRLLVRFQTCGERDCRKPESVLLEVPLLLDAGSR